MLEASYKTMEKQELILIVDDHPTNIKVLFSFLKESGFKVLVAKDGESALEKLKEVLPDIILLDVLMPGIDGFEVCSRLKSSSVTKDIPVIFMTALNDVVDRVKGLSLGAVDYITKPFQHDEVLARVQLHLKLRNLTKTLAEQNVLLKQEIETRVTAETALQKLTQELEQRVIERTAELVNTMNDLQATKDQLELERSKLQAILQQMPAGVIIAEAPSGKLILSNQQVDRILRYPFIPAENVEQYEGYKNFYPDGRPYPVSEFPVTRSLTKGEVVIEEEMSTLRGDGTYGTMSVSSIPIRNEENEIVAVVVTLHDITEIKWTENQLKASLQDKELLLKTMRHQAEQLEQANRIKDDFLAIVSHELRTPLSSILGWSQLLRMGTLDEATTTKAVETIERNSKTQLKIIDDLLDVSRIIRGKVKLNVCPVDLVSIINSVIEDIRPTFEIKNIQIQSTFDRLAGTVMGDSDRLRQIIWNLLSNAVKFTPAEGRLQIRLSTSNNPEDSTTEKYAEIQVSDTGIGIEAKFLPFIFDRFHQVDPTSTREYGGLGLGLAIVRSLVELHNGTVQADSEGIGKGATFTVKLPLLEVTENGKKNTGGNGEVSPVLRANSLADVHVLAVDDDADTCELLSFILKQHDANVTTARSVAEALAAIALSPPDVLISDIGMPGEDGYALMRQLKALELKQGKHIPCVALTAFAREEDRTKALLAGFQMYVSKPIRPVELVSVVANLARDENNNS